MSKRWGVVAAAVLGVALLATGGAGPAQAAETPGIALSSPGEGSVHTGPVSLTGSATMSGNGRVDSVSATIAGGPDGASLPGPFSAGSNGTNTLPFDWGLDLPYNGVYTATVRATGTERPIDFNGAETSPPLVRTFSVERPPAAPGGLTASVNEAKRTVTLSWDANTEPDLIGYCWSYAVGGQSGKDKCLTGTRVVHDLGTLPAGQYQYSVYAVRSAADGSDGGGIASATSAKTATVKSGPPVALAGGTPSTGGSSGGSTSSSGGNRSSTSSSSSAPRAGTRVDLGAFGNLLGNRSELPRAPGTRSDQELDSGFSADLPFAGSPRTSIVTGETAADELSGEPVVSSDGRPESLLFLAAGLLVTVILMHVLWVKGEVDRVPLEPLAPDAALKS